MSTVTKTHVDTYTHSGDPNINSTVYKKTWTITYTLNNITATGDTFTLTSPTITTRFDGNYGFYRGTQFMNNASPTIGEQEVVEAAWVYSDPSNFPEAGISSSRATTYTATKMSTYGSHTLTLNTEDYFNEYNKTIKTLNISMSFMYYLVTASDSSNIVRVLMQSPVANGAYCTGTDTLTNIATLTLDAPPIFNVSPITYNTGDIYANKTTASITLSNLTAKYGGDIVSAVFKIGDQTASRTTDGTLSIALDSVGIFDASVIVTDSRGQVTTQTLGTVSVKEYHVPSLSFNIDRCNANGTLNKNGTYVLITADFGFAYGVETLIQPDVYINNVAQTVTWYTDSSLSTAVNWQDTSSMLSPQTLYAVIGTFNIYTTYTFAITPKGSISTGSTVIKLLSGDYISQGAEGNAVQLKVKTNTGYDNIYPRSNIKQVKYNQNNIPLEMYNKVYPHVNLESETLDEVFDELDNKIAKCGRTFNELEFGAGKDIDIIDNDGHPVDLEYYIIGSIIYVNKIQRYYMLLYSLVYQKSILLSSTNGTSWQKIYEISNHIIIDMKCNHFNVYFLGIDVNSNRLGFYKSNDNTLSNISLILSESISSIPSSLKELDSIVKMAFDLDNNSIVLYKEKSGEIYTWVINSDGSMNSSQKITPTYVGIGTPFVINLYPGYYIVYNNRGYNQNTSSPQYGFIIINVTSDSYPLSFTRCTDVIFKYISNPLPSEANCVYAVKYKLSTSGNFYYDEYTMQKINLYDIISDDSPITITNIYTIESWDVKSLVKLFLCPSGGGHYIYNDMKHDSMIGNGVMYHSMIDPSKDIIEYGKEIQPKIELANGYFNDANRSFVNKISQKLYMYIQETDTSPTVSASSTTDNSSRTNLVDAKLYYSDIKI